MMEHPSASRHVKAALPSCWAVAHGERDTGSRAGAARAQAGRERGPRKSTAGHPGSRPSPRWHCSSNAQVGIPGSSALLQILCAAAFQKIPVIGMAPAAEAG